MENFCGVFGLIWIQILNSYVLNKEMYEVSLGMGSVAANSARVFLTLRY